MNANLGALDSAWGGTHERKGTRCSQGQTCRLTLSASAKLRRPKFQEPASHPWLHPVLCLIAHGDPAENKPGIGSKATGTHPSPPFFPRPWLLCLHCVASASVDCYRVWYGVYL